MREKFYQLDELARARALQDEAAKLHIPAPVLSWQYEIKDADGNIEEKGIGKANSYTRNALNFLAGTVGMGSKAARAIDSFVDGSLNFKFTTGELVHIYYYNLQSDAALILGTSSSAESLNSYALPSSGLTAGVQAIATVFNSTTRKLITTISRAFINNTESTINICESAVTRDYGGSYYILMIRDVFTAIPVEPGKTITWTYVTEVAYPEP